MCDRCLTRLQAARLVGADPEDDEDEDEIAKAARRLRCYYECVTEDMLDDSLGEEDDDDELGLPRY